MIEFDVETTGLQPFSHKHYPFSFQFFDGQAPPVFLPWAPDDQSNREEIQRWLDRGANEGLRAWNSKFDLHFAEESGFKLPPQSCWHDGMITAHAINERRSVALKSVAQELFGKEAAAEQKSVKDWLNTENRRRRKAAKETGTEFEPANFSDVPREIMEPYGLDDVILTRRVCDSMDQVLINKTDLIRVVEFERATMASLYDIEKEGLPAREEEYQKLKYEVLRNVERLHQRVIDLAGDDEFNPNSTPQIEAAFKRRDADLSFTSKKNGKFSADADNLRAIQDELAVAILDFRSEFKVLSTYVDPMIGRSYESSLNAYKEQFIAPDSRIHANYRQVGARTGRMSCSDPNMQNQPRDDLRLRYNIVAEPGFKLVACDLSNIEMCLFAMFCGEGRLLDALRKGEDLHVLTAKMLGFRDRARPGGTYESARQQGKVYNFTTIYGGGLQSIKRYFRVSQDEARVLKERYARAYPEVVRLQQRIDYALRDRGFVMDNFFSGRYFRGNADRDGYKMTNYLVQGTAAALLKTAVNALHQDGVPMVALIHDEIVAHVPENDAVEVRDLIIRRMTEAAEPGGALWTGERQVKMPGGVVKTLPPGPLVPLAADGDIVDRWSDAKPLKEKDSEGKETGKLYYFDPNWANKERRYVA